MNIQISVSVSIPIPILVSKYVYKRKRIDLTLLLTKTLHSPPPPPPPPSTPFNLSKDEFESLWALKNESNLIFQNADKGSTIVILDKESYLKPVETLLKCPSKFKEIPVAPDKHLKCY